MRVNVNALRNFVSINRLVNRQQRNDYHHELVEHLADADEVMGEIFLDERKPTEEDVHAAIRRATLKRAFTPVMMGTALKNKASEIEWDGKRLSLQRVSSLVHSRGCSRSSTA